MRSFLVAVLMSLSVPAFAQSSLGITGAIFTLGMTEDEDGEARAEAAATVDVAITPVHGFQGGLRFADTAGGGIGAAAGHIYMAPRKGQKYGLFAQISDVDGRSMMWGAVGAEGMVSFSDGTMLEVRGGFGVSDAESLDFIFAGLSVAHALSSAVDIETSLDVADFDESALRATTYDAGVTLRYSPPDQPWGVYVGVTHSGQTGRDASDSATRIGLGLTVNLGTAGGTDPATRPFRGTDPVASLLRRGLW